MLDLDEYLTSKNIQGFLANASTSMGFDLECVRLSDDLWRSFLQERHCKYIVLGNMVTPEVFWIETCAKQVTISTGVGEWTELANSGLRRRRAGTNRIGFD
jgi:hypothetical protein